MTSWNQFSQDENVNAPAEDSVEPREPAEAQDEELDEGPAPDEAAPDEAESEPEVDKKAKSVSRARGRGASQMTRAQVQRVLDLRNELTDADDNLVKLLAYITKSDENAEELTIALLTQSVSNDDVLAELVQLLEAADENPFRLSAQLTGMDRAARGRIHSTLAEVSGDTTALPRDEINAAVQLAGLISGLTADQRSLLTSAQKIRG